MAHARRVPIILMFLLVLLGLFCTAPPPAAATTAEGRVLLFNNGAPTYSGVLAAYDTFQAALQADPTDAEAAFFYAVTRIGVFCLAPEPASGATDTLAGLLAGFGMGRSANDDPALGWPYEPPPSRNGSPVLPADAPAGNEVAALLAGPFRAAIADALAKLAKITDPAFTIILTPAETGAGAVEIDYTDVLLLRAVLHTADAVAAWIGAHDLTVDLDHLNRLINADVLMVQRDLLAAHPDLFAFPATGDTAGLLAAARAALLAGIDAASAAYDAMNAETDDQLDDLFAFATPTDRQEAGDLRDLLVAGAAALRNNTIMEIPNDPGQPPDHVDPNVFFGNTGKPARPWRAFLPHLSAGDRIGRDAFDLAAWQALFPDVTSQDDVYALFDLRHRLALPEADVNVDGDAGDWAGVSPVATDETGDFLAPAHGDLKDLYLAVDPQRRYLYWLLTVNAPPAANDLLFQGGVHLEPGPPKVEIFAEFPEQGRTTCALGRYLFFPGGSTYQNLSDDPADCGLAVAVEGRIPAAALDGGEFLALDPHEWVALNHGELIEPEGIFFDNNGDLCELEKFGEFAGLLSPEKFGSFRIDCFPQVPLVFYRPETTVAGEVTCPSYTGPGPIYLWALAERRLGAESISNTVLAGPGPFTIHGVPMGNQVALVGFWDHDDDGLLTAGDVLGATWSRVAAPATGVQLVLNTVVGEGGAELPFSGDVDNDGIVGVGDVLALLSVLVDRQGTPPVWLDANHDGRIDLADVIFLLQRAAAGR